MTIRESLQDKLTRHFAPVHLEIENESHMHATGPRAETHFRLVLVSPAFEGVGRVDRQRRVMALFDEERARGLHALTLRVLTPAEWEAVKDDFEMVSPACRGGSKHDKRK
ncbi:MAG: BolA family transcriptional regulator [Bdellovibrionaceae bacterium]|nr:BolA family transcriptional regulator [Pseudobdellovibrionaceae bacterium]MBX3035191.1 BolA family transcriptional regulator [Pseudobdellovibrionaceae bacterium]